MHNVLGLTGNGPGIDRDSYNGVRGQTVPAASTTPIVALAEVMSAEFWNATIVTTGNAKYTIAVEGSSNYVGRPDGGTPIVAGDWIDLSPFIDIAPGGGTLRAEGDSFPEVINKWILIPQRPGLAPVVRVTATPDGTSSGTSTISVLFWAGATSR